MALTFGQLKLQIRQQLWPAGEASNLVSRHNQDFIDALIDLQTFDECLQQDNTSVIPHCATLYNCGVTVFEAPRGIIKRLEVIDKTHTIPSAPVTASKTGSIVTSSVPFFDASMIGSLIQFADNQTFTIAIFIDSQHVGVVDSTIINPGAPPQPITLGANARINAAGNLELYDPDDMLWHEVTARGTAGDVQIALNQVGVPT